MSEALEFTAPTLEELAPLFPAYEFVGFIAEGGMGAVYRAIQTNLERDVAIKVLPRQLSQDAAYIETFKAEAKVMAKLHHPNLVTIFDFGEADGMLFLVMEFVDGQTLHDVLGNNALEPSDAVQVLEQICEGLEHAHAKGIIHRDIKPANILISNEGVPKIVDFGLARAVAERENPEEVMGTPYFTAPEVIEHPLKVDVRADVYSVTAVLYQMLTGQVPAQNYALPSAFADSLQGFDQLIEKGLHPNPGFRIKSAARLAEEGRAVLEAGGIARRPAGHQALAGGNVGRARSQAHQPVSRMKSSAGVQVKKASAGEVAPVVVRPAAGGGASRAGAGAKKVAKKSSSGAVLALVAVVVCGVLAFFVFSQGKSNGNGSSREANEGGVTGEEAAGNEVELTAEQKQREWQRAQSDFRSILQVNAAALKLGDREVLQGKVVEFDDRYFYQMDYPLAWVDALAFCERFGGQLACLHGEAGLDWVLSELLSERELSAPFYWVGGYDYQGDSTFGWIDGGEFAVGEDQLARSAVDGAGVLAVDVKNGRLIPATGDLEFSFIIEWRKGRDTPGSFANQLKRMADALSAGEVPQWPAGTIGFEGKKYLCIRESLNWQAARVRAESYGGELASLTNESLIEQLETAILLSFTDRDEVWLGARMFLGKGWRWEDGSQWDFAPWLGGEPERIDADPTGLSLTVGSNFEEFKFQAKDPSALANGFLMQVPER